jgi:hypothetical protein
MPWEIQQQYHENKGKVMMPQCLITCHTTPPTYITKLFTGYWTDDTMSTVVETEVFQNAVWIMFQQKGDSWNTFTLYNVLTEHILLNMVYKFLYSDYVAWDYF